MKKALTLFTIAVFFLPLVISAQEKISPAQTSTEGKVSFEEIKKKTTGVKAPLSKDYPRGFESAAEFQKLYAADGPYSYINPEAEILDKRDLTSKHFKCSDGTVTAIVSSGPVHYKKNGVWNTILNDIQPNAQFANFGYANTYNRFQTYYGNNLQNGIRIITEANEQLDLMQNSGVVYLNASLNEISNAGMFSGNVMTQQNENITYGNVLNGVNAHIEHNAAGYELSYEVNDLSGLNIPANTEFVSFREGIKVPEGYHAFSEHDNQVVVIKNNAGRVLLKYKAPSFFEKINKNEDGNVYGKYFTEEKDGFIYIHVLVAAKWFAANGRNFPLIIDPVVTVTPQNAFAWTFTVEEDSGCDYATNNDSDDNMRVGFDDGFFDNDYYQCYANYDISSIPDNSCFINYTYVRWYEYNFTNDASGDDNLKFYFQAYDPIATNPATLTCDQNYADINTTGTWYKLFDAFGTCGGGCYGFYPWNAGWQTFLTTDVKARVQAALGYNFVAFSLDNYNQGGHSDPAGPSNDEWIDFRGYSSGNRPQLIINYETPSTAATVVTASPSTPVCPGTSVTLTRFDGTLGTDANWAWYSVGSSFLGYNNGTISVSPVVTTTYCVQAQGACGNTSCTPVTVTVLTNSVAPTGVTGTNLICNGSSTTLTVQGGSLGSGAVWQWYSGSCGGTFVGNGTSITVSPSTTTTYYVRASGTCNTTGCASQTVTVNAASTAPGSVTAALNLICNGQSTQLTANGATLGTGGVIRWYSTSCGGTLVGTGNPITVSPTATTTYFARAEDPAPCNTLTSCASVVITVNQPSVAPTGITGTSTICNGGNTVLTVQGGTLGTGASWNWYSGNCGGTFVGTGNSVTVSPSSTTTYFVRAENAAPCASPTACASITVTVNQPSTDPSSVSGTNDICEGSSTLLTVVGGSLGTGATWQWYSGSCGGAPVGSGSSVTVTPASTTNYFVRAEGTCNTTNCATITVTVRDSSVVGSISGPPAICIGGSTNLSVSGGHLGYLASWQWWSVSCGGTSEGSGTPITVSPSITTTYYLQAAGNCNTTICSQFTLNVNPLPNGSIDGSTLVCAGVDTVLTFNFTVGTGPFNVIYTDGTNIFSKNGVSTGDTIQVLPSVTTTYTFAQITDANGCVRSSGFLGGATVQVSPLPAISGVSVDDVLCNGGNTGSITLTGSSGVPAYQYSIDNGVTTQSGNTFSNLPAGNYFGFITDALNCSSSYTFNPIVVGEPAVLDHTSTPVDASCANVFDGSITVNATGGTTAYQYSINGGPNQSGNVFNGLSAGTYVVQVTDANGCTDTTHVLINNSYGVTGSIVSQTPVSCFGGVDGTVTVQIIGGIPPYSYSINGVQFVSSPTFTGLAAGNYLVTVRDSKGCTDFVPVTITQPNLLQAQIDSVINILCSGGSTGAIYISVSGGNPAYSFLWSNSATTEDITGLSAGTYNVAITDSKGCTASVGATISQPLPLFLTVASYHNLLCNNDNSGDVDITVNGGVPPYVFAWSNLATSEDIYGLPAGTYSVTVTDANNCSQSVSQTLTEPPLLTSSISGGNVSCNGASDGSVDLTPGGGTTPYNFIWSNGATTEDLSNVSGGIYTVVIHDANNCSTSNSITITEAPALVLSTSVTNILCNGATTGAIDLTVSGGTPQYTFAWNNSATTEDILNVAAGTYSVTVTDNASCTASTSATISAPAPLVVVLAGHADVSCNGGNNGSIDINVFGGTPLYTYAWSNSAASEDLNALTIGTYSVTVSDANLCTATFSATISEPTQITSSITKTDVTCPGASNGSADLTVGGGISPYTFLWSNGATTEDLGGVTGGTYTVIITDANACTASNSVTILEGLPMSISGTVTNVLCNGGTTGAIDITVSGGNIPYTFAWSNMATTEDLTAIAAGNYSVTASDLNSCSASASFTVSQPAALVISATTVDVGCAGGNNGVIDITVYGGVFTYTYAWSNAATTEDLHNISGGTYTVTITDANLCNATSSYVINEPSPITSFVTKTDVSCFGASDGTADLTVNGGTAPYSFLWSDFTGAEDAANMHGGLYYVIITDANNCEHKDSIFILEPAPLTLTTSITDISCYNANDGAIDLTVTGGTLNYSYAWSNGATTEDLNSLQNGIYVVTVTDAHSCTATTSVAIINPSVVTANFFVHDPLCYLSNDGSVDLIPSGGTPGYTFFWSTGATTEDISGIGGGTYTVTITDTKGCTRIDSAVAVEPQPLVTSGFIKHVTCNGDADGFIDITAYGGTLPYSFQWSSGSSTEDVAALPGGNYLVTVTDGNGCQVASLYIVNEPQLLTVNVVATNANCFGSVDAHVAAVPSGGLTPYFYLWNTFDTDSAVYGIGAGHYTVQLTDSNGCFTYDSIEITEPTAISIAGSDTDVVCYGASTGAIDLTVSGGTPTYAYLWSQSSTTEDLSGLTAGVYSVVVTDLNTCTASASFTLTQGQEIVANIGTFDPICHGGTTGAVTAIVSGGVGTFTYLWNTTPPKTSVSVGNLPGGTYGLVATDSKGCTATVSATLIDPAPIDITAISNGAKCFNTATGSVTTTITGGTAPYTFILNGVAQDSGVFTNLPPGNYLVLVTDVNGCQGTTQFSVASPSEISVDLAVTEQVILTGMSTQLLTTTISASPVVNYIWSPDSVVNVSACTDPQNCPNPLAYPKTTTTFTVWVMNADSCFASDTVTVTVLNQPSAFIPTAFSPNGDGLNDFFEVDILGSTNIEISIFSRWGERVYYNANQPNGMINANGWDGNVGDKKAPMDTYVYQMRVKYFDDTEKDFAGTVTIVN